MNFDFSRFSDNDSNKLNKYFNMNNIDYGKDMDKFYRLYNRIIQKDLTIWDDVVKRIKQNSKLNLQTFKITSGQAVISDPAFKFLDINKTSILGNWIYSVKNGNWHGYTQNWITKERPNIVVISHKDYEYDDSRLTYREVAGSHEESKNGNGELGVDSAMISIVDVSKYPRGELFGDKDEDKEYTAWYENLCELQTSENQAFSIDGGYVFHSGWGDGHYPYEFAYDGDKVVQFIVYLIP